MPIDSLKINNKQMKCFVYVLLLVPLLMINSCSSKEEEKKFELIEGIIPEETMINLLVDIHIAEATIKQGKNDNRIRHLPIKKKGNVNVFYYSIFKKYKIDRDIFVESIDYYSQYPEKFEEIYTEVINRLSETQSELKSKK